jgi:phage tail sheath protein FI
MPPSAFVAGVIAQTDAAEGPHRAPAGMDKPVRGVKGLARGVLDSEAGLRNEKGLNCLREFTPGQVVVFGCRTLSGDPNYRYVPVSRTMMVVRKSIKTQLRYAVHRPNTSSLRKSIKRDIEALLERMRREGALAGDKPEQAYRVTVSESREDQTAGVIRVTVEIAPTYPAEFIVVEVSQLIN